MPARAPYAPWLLRSPLIDEEVSERRLEWRGSCKRAFRGRSRDAAAPGRQAAVPARHASCRTSPLRLCSCTGRLNLQVTEHHGSTAQICTHFRSSGAAGPRAARLLPLLAPRGGGRSLGRGARRAQRTAAAAVTLPSPVCVAARLAAIPAEMSQKGRPHAQLAEAGKRMLGFDLAQGSNKPAGQTALIRRRGSGCSAGNPRLRPPPGRPRLPGWHSAGSRRSRHACQLQRIRRLLFRAPPPLQQRSGQLACGRQRLRLQGGQSAARLAGAEAWEGHASQRWQLQCCAKLSRWLLRRGCQRVGAAVGDPSALGCSCCSSMAQALQGEPYC